MLYVFVNDEAFFIQADLLWPFHRGNQRELSDDQKYSNTDWADQGRLSKLHLAFLSVLLHLSMTGDIGSQCGRFGSKAKYVLHNYISRSSYCLTHVFEHGGIEVEADSMVDLQNMHGIHAPALATDVRNYFKTLLLYPYWYSAHITVWML